MLEEWQDIVDPVNAQLLIPLLETRSKTCISLSHLLFPGMRSLESGGVEKIPGESSQTNSSSAVAGIFPDTVTSRFSLLPMALASSGSSRQNAESGADGSINGSSGDSGNVGDGGSVSSVLQKGIASAASSTGSSKGNFLGGLGSLSTLGSLLGGESTKTKK